MPLNETPLMKIFCVRHCSPATKILDFGRPAHRVFFRMLLLTNILLIGAIITVVTEQNFPAAKGYWQLQLVRDQRSVMFV